MITIPIGPYSSDDGRERITHVTFFEPGEDEILLTRINAETGEVEMFPGEES